MKYICVPIIEHFGTKGSTPFKNYTLESNKYITINYCSVNISNIRGHILECICLNRKYVITTKCVYTIIYTNDNYVLKQLDDRCEWFDEHTITNYTIVNDGIAVFDENCELENTLFIEDNYDEDNYDADIHYYIIGTCGLSSNSYFNGYFSQNGELYKLRAGFSDYYDTIRKIYKHLIDPKNDSKLSELTTHYIINRNQDLKFLNNLHIFTKLNLVY